MMTAPRRRLGVLLDDDGHPRACQWCDRGAVVRFKDQYLCPAHLNAEDRHREAAACTRRRVTRGDPRLEGQPE